MLSDNVDHGALTKKEKAVAGTWWITQAFTFAFLVSSWVLASNARGASPVASSCNTNTGAVVFDVVWTSLLVLGMSLATGFCLPMFTRRWLNAITFGALVGGSFFMANLMLLSAVRYGSPVYAQNSTTQGVAALSSSKAVAGFAALLFVCYLVLITMLLVFRDSMLLKDALYTPTPPMSSGGPVSGSVSGSASSQPFVTVPAASMSSMHTAGTSNQ